MGTMTCFPMRTMQDPDSSKGRRSDRLRIIDWRIVSARGKRKVIYGFRLCRDAGHSWVAKARNGGYIFQGYVFFT